MTPVDTFTALPSPGTFDDIDLSHFPRYLPPRSLKPRAYAPSSAIPSNRTIIIVTAWLELLTGNTIATMFIGKAIEKARRKSGPAQMVVVTRSEG
jgi:hypothetical protein